MPSSTMPVPPAVSSPTDLAPSNPVAAHSAVESSLDVDVTVDQDPTSAAVHPRYPRSPSFQRLNLPISGAQGEYHPLATGQGLIPSEDAEGKLIPADGTEEEGDMVLELSDGTAFEGIGFGAQKSVGGECVFQTGKFLLHSSLLALREKVDGLRQ